MKDIRKYTVYPSDLDIFSSFKHVAEYCAECNYEEHLDYCDHTRFVVNVNENRRILAGSFAEFLEILERYPHRFLCMYTRIGTRKGLMT